MKRVEISVINDLVTDQRLHRMISTLQSMGIQVHVVGRKLPWSIEMGEVSFAYRRFAMIFRKGPLFYAFYNLRLFFYLLLKRKADLYVSIDLDTLSANYFISKFRKVPLLYDSHEYFTEVPELVGRPKVKRFWERLEARIVPNLKYAMAVSASISRVYEEKYGVHFETVRNLSDKVLLESCLNVVEKCQSPYTLIYQGALNKGRGVELMIRAMVYLEDVELCIVGDGDVADELYVLADELGVSNKVVFRGKVSPDALKGITAGCHLGLSLEEDLGLNYRMALPNKVFDYIQARIPVLCSDLPEMASLVRNYEVGEVCESRNPKELAGQIWRMLTDKNALELWAGKLEIAAEVLVWEKEEEKLKSLVSEALE